MSETIERSTELRDPKGAKQARGQRPEVRGQAEGPALPQVIRLLHSRVVTAKIQTYEPGGCNGVKLMLDGGEVVMWEPAGTSLEREQRQQEMLEKLDKMFGAVAL